MINIVILNTKICYQNQKSILSKSQASSVPTVPRKSSRLLTNYSKASKPKPLSTSCRRLWPSAQKPKMISFPVFSKNSKPLVTPPSRNRSFLKVALQTRDYWRSRWSRTMRLTKFRQSFRNKSWGLTLLTESMRVSFSSLGSVMTVRS